MKKIARIPFFKSLQDEKEHVLVSLVLLFCPDMLDLVERRKVEKINAFYSKSQYIVKQHKSPVDFRWRTPS